MIPARRLLASAATARPTVLSAVRRQHTIAPAAISQIETRWVKLPECEQGAIADYLYEKQKGDWKKLTADEKRAAYWIAYGPYGARTTIDPTLKWKVLGWTSFFFGISVGAWVLWTDKVVPPLRTHTKEWKEEEERRAIANKQNPFTGTYAKYRKEVLGEKD
ncbi:cytochrome c oxidase subunit IV family [Phlyctochytrium arcticum]|nr:cytochrome c oxidase subunit IV family [Phlyctochytrium arcticum]